MSFVLQEGSGPRPDLVSRLAPALDILSVDWWRDSDIVDGEDGEELEDAASDLDDIVNVEDIESSCDSSDGE